MVIAMLAEFRKYYKKDLTKSIFCNQWTYQTICCYIHRTHCNECSCRIVCKKYEHSGVTNEYNIMPIKYCTLLTLARLGKPKGIDDDTRDE